MSHRDTLENSKYRNWVKAGLSLKYLKDGLSEFAQNVAQSAHQTIVQAAGVTPGATCCSCKIRTLKPLHTPSQCTRGQAGCNCSHENTHRCQNKLCDAMYEQIMKHQGSGETYWGNTDVTKWTIVPWEVAKCYIFASGYKTTQSAADTDVVGLLHLFINNKIFQGHLSCSITVLDKVRKWRHDIFHSKTMELEDQELMSGIADIITILEDEQELKELESSKQAVQNLRELQSKNFIITMDNEAEICKAAVGSCIEKTDELAADIKQTKEKMDEAICQLKTQQMEMSSVNVANNVPLGLEKLKKDGDELETEEQIGQHVQPVEQGIQTQIIYLRQRIDSHDNLIESLQKRLTKTEEELNGLKQAQERRQQHLDEIQSKQELQTNLKEIYISVYVKTSQSPLQRTRNDIDISEVYTEPEINKRVEELLPSGDTSDQEVPVNGYGDIFIGPCEHNKRIYLIGDVGTGKSAFCKKMISTWCRSSDLPQTDDKKFMERFELLFYPPLISLRKINDVRVMIADYYELSKETVNDIFRTMPERCLVLLDGLDEWKHKEIGLQREHETVGLPKAFDMKDVTIVTTSRPSAPGIINMKHSDYDLKVMVKGVRKYEAMVEKYMPKTLTKSDLVCKVQQMKIKDLEKMPLVLQQIIWLLSNDEKVGDCVSEIYSSLVNIALRWSQQKPIPDRSTKNSIFSNLCLPEKLTKSFPAFEDHKTVAFVLGKLAFDSLTEENQLSFGQRLFESIDESVNNSLRTFILQTGLLTEEVRFNPTTEDTHFRFTHTSFLEYFAALYIASHKKIETSTCHPSGQSHDLGVFSILRKRCQSSEAVLQLENMFALVCGLCPSSTEDICKFLRDKVNEYEDFDVVYTRDYRPRESIAKRFEELVLRCLCERQRSDPSCDVRILLRDVVIEDSLESTTEAIELIEKYVDDHNVRSLYLHKLPDQNILRFHQLRTLVLIHIRLSHTGMSSLATYITRCKTLTNLFVNLTDCSDHISACRHFIDLANHSNLQTANLLCPKNFVVRIPNTPVLQHFVLWISHHVDPVEFLSAERTQLTTLQLGYISCGSDVMSCIAELTNQSKLLRNIMLENIRNADQNNEKHYLDLSGHNHLQLFEIHDNDSLCVDAVNTSQLSECSTDSREVLQCLIKSTNLVALQLYNLQYDDKVHNVVSKLLRLKELKLNKMIVDAVFEVAPEMSSISSIELYHARMSPCTWQKFVDSLDRLDQCVTVKKGLAERNSSSEAEGLKQCPEKYYFHEEPYRFSFVTVKK